MRRAFAVILLVVFAGGSEGAALCLTASSAPGGRSHDCCGKQAVSPASPTSACCALSRPDSEIPPSGSQVATETSVALSPATGLTAEPEDIAVPVTWPKISANDNPSTVPLYLQHLSLLI